MCPFQVRAYCTALRCLPRMLLRAAAEAMALYKRLYTNTKNSSDTQEGIINLARVIGELAEEVSQRSAALCVCGGGGGYRPTRHGL